MTRIEMEFSNGERWALPLAVVAEHRATEYETPGQPEWYEEKAYLMHNTDEALDWLRNNMYWSEVEPYLKQTRPAQQPDKESEFSNCEMTIINAQDDV